MTNINVARPGAGAKAISIRVNGTERPLPSDARVSLLDALRDYLDLPGTKKGCNQGACGACTVLLDGERVLACFTLAVQCEGREVTTIEGLRTAAGELHPLQRAFIENDGFQCGYCTSGQICSAIGMVAEIRRGVPSAFSADVASERFDFTPAEIRERMSGNLCRCGAYNGIVAAIRDTFADEASH